MLKQISLFFKRNMHVIIFIILLTILFCVTVYADPADQVWNTVRDLVKKWVTRLGGVVMFVGGIMFGLGWKNDDAEQKSRGVGTLISGAIVTALSAGITSFFDL